MKAADLISALHAKLKTKSLAELGRALGLSYQTFFNWRDGESLSASQVATVVAKARNAAIEDAQRKTIKPIVEFYRLDRKLTNQECSERIFDGGKSGMLYQRQLKEYLDSTHGLYIFYDSQGKALYVGKAVDQSLWKEINHAFNRERQVQKISLVDHPDGNREFRPGYEKLRQPRPTQLELCDMAAYFSAYEISDGMIDDLEALLVRGFANNLLNVRMEKFASSR